MDSQGQLQRNYGHHQAEEPVKINHPEEEEHHEKGPSKVLKKVKEKAKKIKKALTKHGHEHDRGHQHIPDDHDLDQEDDDEDDYKDPQIHGGAPKKTHIPVKENELIPPGTKAFPVSSSHATRGVDPYASHGHKAPSRPATLTPHNTPVSLTEDVTRTSVPGRGLGSHGGISNDQSTVTVPTGKATGEIGAATSAASLGRKKETSQDDQLGLGKDIPVRSHDFDVKSGSDLEPNQSSYSDKIASATTVLTEKLTPIYDKVKETGANVMTKLPLSSTETQGQDKGVSAREYLTEKLSPGEEDKALSEVVTEKLHLSENAREKKGIVTQSEEVEKRLGGFSDPSSKEERKHGEAFAEEGEGGMVEKLRDAVNSWIAGTTEEVVQKSTESSSQTLGSTVGNIAAGKTDAGDNSEAVRVQKKFQKSGK
ncbi:hypothetical protein AALP_AA7G083100 [Arabis alpina]|uniref:Low-temperature-induced 65 kDa protein n=1 Tax=Arabis alpina TaxID=50452 RepID=A0A087GGQ5_ARAAL|nr:hypothetical protein AALP_AA7G083100 [Arabis alpina]